MPLTTDELVTAFVDEAAEHLSGIEADLLAIERTGNTADPSLVNKVFRAAHSIKGGAGFVGLINIKDLSHKMETILGSVRCGALLPDSGIITVLLAASETLKQLVENVTESDAMDITASLRALDGLIQKSSSPSETAISEAQPLHIVPTSEPSRPLSPEVEKPSSSASRAYAAMQVSEEFILHARNDGKHIYLLDVDPAQPGLFHDKNAADIIDELKTYGTVLSHQCEKRTDTAFAETSPEDAVTLHAVFACVLNPEDMALLLEIDRMHLTLMDEAADRVPSLNPHATQPPEIPLPDETIRPEATPDTTIADRRAHPETVPSTSDAAYDQMPAPAALISAPTNLSPPVKSEKPHTSDSSPTSIRVHVQVLDALMNLASELVLSRNQLLKSISTHDHRQAEIVGKRLDHITSDLQRVIMLTRMQPVGNLLNKFPLVVRNLSHELGKDIAFDIEGADVELDRSLLEAMSDPLTHLIRNAAGHGIETPEVRKSLAKPGAGKITVKALNEAGQVVIEVIDDGAGIDPNRVASTAIAKGFVTEEQIRVMTDKDRLNLIFLPGFSTAGQVSELSGRGVGMDVVKTNLDTLGGLVDIDSTPGKGARIRIRLPLTLAIIPSQIVSAGNERFAIPQINLEELLRIPAAKVKERVELVGNAEVVRLRGKLLPLVRVTDVLGISRTYIDQKTGLRIRDRRMAVADRRSRKTPLIADDFMADDDADMVTKKELRLPHRTGPEPPGMAYPPGLPAEPPAIFRSGEDRRYRAVSALNIAVVSTGHMKYGLIVDAFHDAEEIVVKPLGRHLKTCRGYAGATIMGDGRVALILDVNDLAEMAELFSIDGAQRAGEVAREAAPDIPMTADPLNLLIFRNAPDEQFAMPMNQVLRIERIQWRDIQSLGGVRTIQYRGGNLRVFSIDEIARVTPLADCGHLLVIVFMIAGRELGILATGPVDSVITDAGIDGDALKQPGVMGSIVLKSATTLLVDVLEIVRTFYPDWFRDSPRAERSLPARITVLVVDDSRFFRTQITSFIAGEGYEVIDAEDGEAAWKILQSSDQHISLVVTDIEMPRLNGIGLTERIRNDARFTGLPIIALTTLADDRAMNRARQAGVNEYQIKLDKERLASSIAALLTTHAVF